MNETRKRLILLHHHLQTKHSIRSILVLSVMKRVSMRLRMSYLLRILQLMYRILRCFLLVLPVPVTELKRKRTT
ncbi:unnamed protein product [Cylicostephanus goldi]|uniref:Uncharacterized protein n=1 Tax=Cylicostephanus goldi TaxID=71465 RepID=A0A3P6R9H6_CYLGO|nr:unnamed protein product [Cylicostephanus goldi]